MLVLAVSVQAQSNYSLTDEGKTKVSPQAVSLKNPWVGSTFSYNIAGEGLDESFLFSARVMFFAFKSEKFGLPVVGSAAPLNTDALLSASGYNAGLYPYYVLKSGANIDLVAHGGVGYKAIPGDSTTATVNQLRALGGLEVAFWGSGRDKSATVLSVTPVYTLNDNIDNDFFLEGTVIVPIGEFLGLLAETQIPFDGRKATFRAGVIVRKQL